MYALGPISTPNSSDLCEALGIEDGRVSLILSNDYSDDAEWFAEKVKSVIASLNERWNRFGTRQSFQGGSGKSHEKQLNRSFLIR